MDNILIPFTLYNNNIKGRITRLDDQLDLVLKQHQYPEKISRTLGELLLVASLLGSQFKDEVTLSIQLQTSGMIKYIIVDYQTPRNIRGYAKYDDSLAYMNDAILSVTIDHKGKRYQGVVEVNNLNIEEAIRKYFSQSEQINTSLKLSICNLDNTWYGGGILIQELPNIDDENLWQEANILLSTIKDSELLNPKLSLEQLLYSVYHEASVKIFDKIIITHKCRCSKEKAENIIKSIDINEAKKLVIDGKLSVNCQFCNVSQYFTLNDVKSLYK
jgi:molecular chaperone Hsp33